MTEQQMTQRLQDRAEELLLIPEVKKEMLSKPSEDEAKEWLYHQALITLMFTHEERMAGLITKNLTEKKMSQLSKTYQQIRAKHGNPIVWFQDESHILAIRESAVCTSAVLGTILTNNGRKEYEVTGFPNSEMDINISKMVRAGNKVAIVTQLKDQQEKRKLDKINRQK